MFTTTLPGTPENTESETIPPQVDKSNTLISISHTLWKTHEGQFFALADERLNVTNNSTARWLFKTPLVENDSLEKYIHFAFNIGSDSKANVKFFEAPTIGTLGTPVNTIYCINRVKDTSTSFLTYSQPTITANGQLMSINIMGSAGGSGNALTGGHSEMNIPEFILKPDTYYLLAAMALQANTNFALMATFYLGIA